MGLETRKISKHLDRTLCIYMTACNCAYCAGIWEVNVSGRRCPRASVWRCPLPMAHHVWRHRTITALWCMWLRRDYCNAANAGAPSDIRLPCAPLPSRSSSHGLACAADGNGVVGAPVPVAEFSAKPGRGPSVVELMLRRQSIRAGSRRVLCKCTPQPRHRLPKRCSGTQRETFSARYWRTPI
eukprot:SAG31_NODE_1024_length_10294_cov_7.215400_2_plen_183_part_00